MSRMKERVAMSKFYSTEGGKRKGTMEEKIAFLAGSLWADKTMVEKACQWIESYLFDIGFPDDWCRDSPNIKSGKERFIKAMLEEE